VTETREPYEMIYLFRRSFGLPELIQNWMRNKNETKGDLEHPTFSMCL